jgi:hypothetical protein
LFYLGQCSVTTCGICGKKLDHPQFLLLFIIFIIIAQQISWFRKLDLLQLP